MMFSFPRASLALLLTLHASSTFALDHDKCYVTKFKSASCAETFASEHPDLVIRPLTALKAGIVEVTDTYTEEDLDADPCVDFCFQDVLEEILFEPDSEGERKLVDETLLDEKSDEGRDLQTLPWNIAATNAHLVSDANAASITTCLMLTGVTLPHVDLPDESIISGFADNSAGFGGPDGWKTDSHKPGHGTHSVGILSALDNAIGVVGMIPSGTMPIHMVKIFKELNMLWSSDLAVAFDSCMSAGSDIITMPFVSGSANATALSPLIDYLYEVEDVLLVGESYKDKFPGIVPSVIKSASVKQDGSIHHHGPSVELSAPGFAKEITSTLPKNKFGTTGGFEASVHVAGVAALVWSNNRQKSAQEIRKCLQDSASDLGAPGFDTTFGYGMVDAFAANELCKDDEPTPPPAPSGGGGWEINLTKPVIIVEPPICPGVYHLETCYNISDKDYTVTISEEDCQTSTPDLPILNITDNFDVPGYNNLEIQMLYNQSVIQDGSLWRANATGGNVRFCVTVSLFYQDTKINFHESNYWIQVDSLTDFNTTIDIMYEAPEQYTETIDYEEDIIAYPCDDSYNEIIPAPVLSQGDYAQICLETVGTSKFEIHSVKDVLVDQDNAFPYPYVTNYVDSRLATSTCINSNTTDAVCKVKMQLVAYYFQDSDPSDLDVVGTVKLDYLGVGGYRHLEKEINIPMFDSAPRDLVAQNGGDNRGKFTSTIEIAGEASKSSAGMPVLGGALATVLALVLGSALYV